MIPRDARLRTELIALIILKIGILTVLWFLFVHGARVPVDADVMARHAAPACFAQSDKHCAPTTGLSSTGVPNGY
jgi:hypothetical protein